jgi:hypothetical protein
MRRPGVRSDDASDDQLARIGDDVPAAGPVSFETAPLARPRRTMPAVAVVLVIAAVLAVAVVKPWGDGSTAASLAPLAGGPAATAAGLGGADASASAAISTGASVDGSGDGSGTVGSALEPAPPPETLATIVHRLVTREGSWGIGVGGEGPRLIRDDLWVEWAPLDPVDAGSIPDDLSRWPGTDLCGGVPVLFDRPYILAVTVPPGLPPDWRILAWRTDGVTIDDLSTAVRQVSPPGNRQISYLEFPNNAIWPDGRYEFHVVAGDHVLAMTVCLSRS